MKEYLIQFRPFLLFLGKFILTYLVLTFLYQLYLNAYDNQKMEVDGITQMVAEQSKSVLSFFDADAKILTNPEEASIKLFYNNTWVARIIEGCNGISVLILFVGFVIAFTGKFKQTVLFTISGILLIYVFNILRIALLAMAIFHYPEYEQLLHGVLFPLIIYSIVFILWVIWVNKFSFYAEKNTK